MATRTKSVLVIFSLVFLSFIATSNSTPFIYLHGLGDSCFVEKYTTAYFSFLSGAPGTCIEIGNGALDSWTKPIDQQIQIACDKIKASPILSQGYNIVAVSQGNIIARGVIEFCGGPPVKNYISIAGPHAGTIFTHCNVPFLCPNKDSLLQNGIYSEAVQNQFAPSNYVKLPNAIPEYLRGCKVLPRLNNELPEKNVTFKQRFSSLKNLVLIKNALEQILVPKETSWFGYYAEDDSNQILPPKETRLYQEDWIGLRALDEAGKVKFYTASGIHAVLTNSEILEFVVPYLRN